MVQLAYRVWPSCFQAYVKDLSWTSKFNNYFINRLKKAANEVLRAVVVDLLTNPADGAVISLLA